MATGDAAAAKVQRLLEDFDTYDTHVDIISAFQWLFLRSGLFTGHVRHFERFPHITMPDGTESTPDFTVLFSDHTGLVGEISKLALHENSVDKAVKQIGKYALLDRLPADAKGNCQPITDVNVLQLVLFRDGLDAVRRIIVERMLNPDHPYKPPKAPVIVQYSRDDVRYTFQRLQNPENGSLPSSQDPMTVGYLLDRGLNPPIRKFVGIKATAKFMNDPIDPLYLATHLWTQHWPTEFPDLAEDVTVSPKEIADVLRERFGKCRADEVRRALGLLASAGLAADNGDNTWEVSRKQLRLRGEHDVHRIIAHKRPNRPNRSSRRAPPNNDRSSSARTRYSDACAQTPPGFGTYAMKGEPQADSLPARMPLPLPT